MTATCMDRVSPHMPSWEGECMKDKIPTHTLVSVNLRTHSKAGTMASATGLSFCLPLGKKIPNRDGSSVCRKFCLLHTGAHGLSFTHILRIEASELEVLRGLWYPQP